MTHEQELTIEQIRELLDYDAESGALKWRARTPRLFPDGNTGAAALCAGWNKRWAGREALTSDYSGYRVGCVMGRYCYAHRVAWALGQGEWPKGHIDHINGNKSDNRIVNLRDVSQSLNRRNGSYALGASGVRGIRERSGRWYAYGKLMDRQVHLGVFDTLEEAIHVRREWARRNGFTARHEARTNAG